VVLVMNVLPVSETPPSYISTLDIMWDCRMAEEYFSLTKTHVSNMAESCQPAERVM
jgi:hypothetical protein